MSDNEADSAAEEKCGDDHETDLATVITVSLSLLVSQKSCGFIRDSEPPDKLSNTHFLHVGTHF